MKFVDQKTRAILREEANKRMAESDSQTATALDFILTLLDTADILQMRLDQTSPTAGGEDDR